MIQSNTFSINLNKQDDSSIELVGKIPASLVEKQKKLAIEKYNKERTFDGFRKGQATEEVILKEVGELVVWTEAGKLALQTSISDIFEEQKIDVIGQPVFTVTNSAIDQDISFKLDCMILPTISLPNYREILKDVSKPKEEAVTDADVDNILLDIRKGLYRKDNNNKDPNSIAEHELPVLTDEVVAKLSTKHTTLASFKEFVKTNLVESKKRATIEKYRSEIAKKILDKTNIKVPDVLVESEINKMVEETKAQAGQFGSNFDDFLKHLGKTLEEFRAQIRNDAVFRVKLQLILSEIAKTENIVPDKDLVQKEVERFSLKQPNINKEHLKAHIGGLMTNDAVFRFLEDIVNKQ